MFFGVAPAGAMYALPAMLLNNSKPIFDERVREGAVIVASAVLSGKPQQKNNALATAHTTVFVALHHWAKPPNYFL